MSRMTPLVRQFVEQGRVDDCPIIDTHTHPDRFSTIYFPDPDPDGILRTMDRCGVRKIGVVPHAALADPVDGNAFTLKLVQAYPERMMGYWFYSPHYPELLEDAQTRVLETPGLVGYKVHPSWSGYPLTGDAYQPLFAWANAHGLIVLSHTWSESRCNTAACRWVAERYPEMRFILGHSCWGDWEGAIALAKEFPHVYLELTAAERMPGFIDLVAREGCAHKLLFGTDLPWFDPHFTLGCVLFADISDDDRRAILYGNAERLFSHASPLPST